MIRNIVLKAYVVTLDIDWVVLVEMLPVLKDSLVVVLFKELVVLLVLVVVLLVLVLLVVVMVLIIELVVVGHVEKDPLQEVILWHVTSLLSIISTSAGFSDCGKGNSAKRKQCSTTESKMCSTKFTT